jgi:putative PIN family toxin of toxin-antitoxin system
MQENNVVFDTNVWVSYFIKNKAKEIFAMKANSGIEIFRCNELTDELKDVLGRDKIKKHLTNTMEDCLEIYELATTPVSVKGKFTGCRDPKDNYIFDLALAAKAKYIVSGDRDVTETKTEKPIETVSLTRFKEILRARNN